ncbi:MAG: hypothetical protein ACI95C_002956 [Pseudohongiellaceae bacterium]
MEKEVTHITSSTRYGGHFTSVGIRLKLMKPQP